ncbi:MAG: hypothetical protein ACFFG0_03660 [Candidatus Thorarchaeota archaeon]
MLTWAICWLIINMIKNDVSVEFNGLVIFIPIIADLLIIFLITNVFYKIFKKEK